MVNINPNGAFRPLLSCARPPLTGGSVYLSDPRTHVVTLNNVVTGALTDLLLDLINGYLSFAAFLFLARIVSDMGTSIPIAPYLVANRSLCLMGNL